MYLSIISIFGFCLKGYGYIDHLT